MDTQRKRVYGYRQNILEGANCKRLILEMIYKQISHYLDLFLAKDYGAECFARWAGKELALEIEAREFRGMDYATAAAYAKDLASEAVETQVLEAIEENLPEDADPSEWNWEALAKAVNTRWRLGVRDRELRQLGRDKVGERLIDQARAMVEKVDLSGGAQYLDPDFPLASACGWVRRKFGIELSPDQVRPLELDALKQLVRERAEAAYAEKEVEYPVKRALAYFTVRDALGHKRYDREGLAAWAAQRFEVSVDVELFRHKQREEIQELLLEYSRRFLAQAPAAMAEAHARLVALFDPDAPRDRILHKAHQDGRLAEFVAWLKKNHGCELEPARLLHMKPQELENQVAAAVEEHYRPEMRRMERALLLHILDSTWKDHLLVMDHLRGSVGLRGYAQIDPKVEYKREGMRLFEDMWNRVGEKVTDLVFRIEELDDSEVGAMWRRGQAVHQQAPTPDSIAAQQEEAIRGTQAGHKPEPIRNRQRQVGRNDPCPCGSGKKFKKCCMGKGSVGVG
jgi:preprotein translocase subunit SecA